MEVLTRVCPQCNSFLQVVETTVDHPAAPPPSCPVCNTVFLTADDGQRWDSLQKRFFTSWRKNEQRIVRVLRKGKTAEQIAELMERVSIRYDGLQSGVNIPFVERHESAVKMAFAKMGRPTIARWTAIPNGTGGYILCLEADDYVARFSEADFELNSDEFERLLTEDRRRHD